MPSANFVTLDKFPLARTHPRTNDLVRANDTFFLERWPFHSDAHREHFTKSDMGTFVAKC